MEIKYLETSKKIIICNYCNGLGKTKDIAASRVEDTYIYCSCIHCKGSGRLKVTTIIEQYQEGENL